MNLIPYDIKKLTRKHTRTNIQKYIEKFIDMDIACAKVDGYECKSTHIAVQTLNRSTKRYGYYHVKAIERENNVYLIRLDK